jgi:hypothetical protein
MGSHDRIKRHRKRFAVRPPSAHLRNGQGRAPAQDDGVIVIVADRIPPGVERRQPMSSGHVCGIGCLDRGPEVEEVVPAVIDEDRF